MNFVFTVFAEDTIGVLAFALFAVLVYILIAIAFRKYSGRHTRNTSEKDPSEGQRRHLFTGKKDPERHSRKDFSRDMIPENGIGGNQFYQNES